MTPEQRALAAAFMAECWAPVPEYHDGDPLPKRRPRRRPENVNKPVDRARKKAS